MVYRTVDIVTKLGIEQTLALCMLNYFNLHKDNKNYVKARRVVRTVMQVFVDKSASRYRGPFKVIFDIVMNDALKCIVDGSKNIIIDDDESVVRLCEIMDHIWYYGDNPYREVYDYE
jgi:hypothetical protein